MKRIRVLLVDDQALFREGLATLLGLNPELELVGEAGNGAAAVEMWARLRPEVVLMDLRMPVMNGYEAVRSIRALPRRDARSVPILAMSADAYPEDVERCLQAGMNGHIAKPVDPQLLFRQIARFCGKRP